MRIRSTDPPTSARGAARLCTTMTVALAFALPVPGQLLDGPVAVYSQNGAEARLDLVDAPEYLDRLGGGDLSLNGGGVTVGDFDGDGFPELVIGMPLEDHAAEDAGWVHVIPGSAAGPDAAHEDERVWSLQGAIDGSPAADDLFGLAVATGHFNDDPYADLAVGAPGKGVTDIVTYAEAGTVNIIYGGPDGLQETGNRQLWQGRSIDGGTVPGDLETGDLFGAALAVGDFDCDGLDDLAVGVRHEDFGTGGPGTLVDAGAVVVLYATPAGLVPSGAQLLRREGDAANYDRFGVALAAGHFDEDACADLAVGVPGHDVGAAVAAGAVDVFSGSAGGLDPASGETWTLNSPDVAGVAAQADGLGWALTTGDFDGDGIDDLAAGLPFRDANVSTSDSGALVVLYGTPTGLSGIDSLYLDQGVGGVDEATDPNDEFGRSLAAGDLDADGADELAVGVRGESVSTARAIVDYAGAVHLFDGVPGVGLVIDGNQVLDTVLVPDPAQPDALGTHVLLRDLDDSGSADLIATVPNRTVSDGIGPVDFAGEVIVMLTPGPRLFRDGFEGGDTTPWSTTIP